MVDEILVGLSVAERDEFMRLLTVVRTNLSSQREQDRTVHG